MLFRLVRPAVSYASVSGLFRFFKLPASGGNPALAAVLDAARRGDKEMTLRLLHQSIQLLLGLLVQVRRRAIEDARRLA